MNTVSRILIFVFVFLPIVSFAAYERVSKGDTITMGEFVYDDNYVATTTANCTVTIYDPANTLKVNAQSMTANANGWYYYDYTVGASETEGVWPSFMVCGSALNGDLVKQDKTFVVGATIVSTSTTASAVWNASTRTLTSLAALATDVWSAATRTLTGAGLDSGSLATLANIETATSSLGAAITNSQTAINTNTDNRVTTATSSLAAVVNANTNTAVSNASTSIGSMIGNLPSLVWSYSTRTLTSMGSLATDVWSAATRTLTGAGLDSGSLATLANIETATSSLGAAISNSTVSGSGTGWLVRMSDANQVLGGAQYRVKVYTTYNSAPTNSSSTPTVTLYDVDRNTVVSAVAMTNIGTGIYEYVYNVSTNAAQGIWETIVSTNTNGSQTLTISDYWEVRGSPAQVIIRDVTDVSTPSIAADVTITNEGSTGYEYQYEWCVVSSQSDSCGGGDDVYYASAAKYINVGEDWNTTLSATVPNAGTYFFKLVVYFGSESSGSSRSFTATSQSSGGGAASGGGGGGGGGGGVVSVPVVTVASACSGADLNGDKKVNSIDFSILLAFWKTNPPFKNTCVDLNGDKKVNSIDFSILLSRWGRIMN